MCKVMILTGIQDSPAALDFMKACEPEMSSGNTDGIGYSAINSKNELFMEKWHRNKHFLSTENVVTPENLEAEIKPALAILAKYTNVPDFAVNYMSHGNITRDDLKTVTMHTRMATCGKTMENTHPFVDQETSLIHNGIINNSYQLKNNKISTCDSESALQIYLRDSLGTKSMSDRKDAYQSFLDELRGYWAFGILAKAKNGRYALDVIKGGAQLYFAYIPELGNTETIVFATTQQIIKTACKTMGFKTPEISDLKDDSLSRFDAVTGNLVSYVDFAKKKTGHVSNYNGYESSYDTFTKEFLDSREKVTKDTKLVRFDKTKAEYEDKLKANELEMFDVMTEELPFVFSEYDLFQGSNFAMFYENLPKALKNNIDRKWKDKTVGIALIMQVIELQNEGKLTQAWDLLYNSKIA